MQFETPGGGTRLRPLVGWATVRLPDGTTAVEPAVLDGSLWASVAIASDLAEDGEYVSGVLPASGLAAELLGYGLSPGEQHPIEKTQEENLAPTKEA
ncbi:hypothetical protein [Micromonospora echinospora]|uniref:hypothetical protein n=1 Tax=Micromonospora echinospora TaxID=1877 RepID=UPI003A84D503